MDRFRDASALYRARRQGGAWEDIGAKAFMDSVWAMKAGLDELGVSPGDRVGLLSENRPEWAITDYACLAGHWPDVPIYPNLPPGQIAYQLRDCRAKAICVSTARQLEKVQSIRQDLPDLEFIVGFDDSLAGPGIVRLRDLMTRGREARVRHLQWREEALTARPDDLATIIYTSGTTGEPKGVMLTHGNLAANVRAALTVLDVHPGDECLSFLPLSHVFERTAGHYVMLAAGVTITYARSVESVAADLLDRQPTVLTSVPRVYEKVFSRVVEAGQDSPVRRRLFAWARRTGESWASHRLEGRPVPAGLALRHRLADRVVFQRIRERMGGRLRLCISGGAPLAADIGRFFYAAGIPILEGYGLTETSPVVAVNTLERPRFGSVGPPLPGVEVRIADDGEILTRGPNVMLGYYNRPDATAEAIGPDGWFRTGDIGYLDEDGYLHITDRKKDIIVTAGGKNIAPQPIEARLRQAPHIANAVMIGDKRKYPVALIVPDFERLRTWAREHGVVPQGDEELTANAEARALIEGEARQQIRDLARFEVPKKFLILPRDLTVDGGELTPKLSVRRRIVEERFRAEIAALYHDSAELERVVSGG